MKKSFLFLFLFFSLIFSFSFADTVFTFDSGKYSVYSYSCTTESEYLSVFNNLDNLTPNRISPALPDLIVPDETVFNYPYQTFIYGGYGRYYYLFTRNPLYSQWSTVSSMDYVVNDFKSLFYESGKDSYLSYSIPLGGSSWDILGKTPASNNVTNSFIDDSAIYYANYDLLNYHNSTVVYSASLDVPVSMLNPLTSEEMTSLFNNINSSDFSQRPSNYNKYFVNYNTWTHQYKIYFYPDNRTLGGMFIENDSGVDYRISEYSEGVFPSLGNLGGFDYYVFSCYEGDSFSFDRTVFSNDFMNTSIGVADMPIVYTSHLICWFMQDSDNNFVEDSVNNLDKVVIGGDVIEPSIGETTSNYNFLELFIDNLRRLFFPDFSFFDEFFDSYFYNNLIDGISPRYNQLVDVLTSTVSEPPVITLDFSQAESDINYGGLVTALDLSWYARFKPTVDFFLISVTYGVFFYRLIHDLPNIINGVSGSFHYGSGISEKRRKGGNEQ